MAEFSEDRPTEDAPIDGGRSRRIAEIVHAALEVPAAERSSFLEEACGGDETLRREAEALLAADRTAVGVAAPPPPSPGLVGSSLSHYRIVEPLGAGGMGEVYLAEDEKLGRRVALKVLPRGLAASPERLARFRREARTVAALNHPNIVTLHSTEDAQGLHFLTMELLEGGTLQGKIRPGGLAPEELLRLALPLADALAAAHAQGITHRDLKPANVMISGDGRIKVVDFGLAKVSAGGAEDREGSTSLTVDGRILGTVAYMSPEQVVGHPVDCRSDVFSLGVVLYELATGGHPFEAPSRAEFMSKILRDEPEPASARNPRLPRRLDAILGRCLEKDPDRRYPDARALHEDLSSFQRSAAVDGSVDRPSWRLGAAVAAGLLAAALLAVTLVRPGRLPDRAPAPAPATAAAVPARTGVAVLPFQNLTGDPQLDWLRAGLTEMLVTDLSQSPRLEVLGTARLHQILADVGALENRSFSFEQVRQVAQRAAVRKVIRGSYARVESQVVIAFQIEDGATGGILGSERVQGPGGERLLSLVDALGAAVHRQLDPVAPSASPVALQDVTTSSVEAWRLYAEALGLHYQAKNPEAIVLLEKAVELDPGFALALADLGSLHGNLGHQGLSMSYLGRAVERAERLPVHQRSLIQGRFYAKRWGTYGRAVESFRETLRLFPGRDAPRNNLAHLEAYLERYDSAAREFETLLAQGTQFAPTVTSAANVQAALGRFEQGHRLLLDLAGRTPDSWIAQAGLGWHLTQWGKLDEALPALERAAALRPGEVTVLHASWRLAVLREDWPMAERRARDLARLDDPYARWRGALCLARNAQHRGAFDEALDHLAAAARAFPQPEAFTAMAHGWTADLLLDLGAPARALAEAERARKLAPGDWPELQAMFLAALAQQELGRPAAADALLAELERRAALNPNAVEERQILRLEGRLALARGNPAAAVAALRQAAARLPPHGIELHWHVQSDHVPVWDDLGRAELAAGRSAEARRWFEKVAASGAEHIEFPLAYRRGKELLSRRGLLPRTAARDGRRP